MKSFTAKEFSRCPAKVYEAAKEDGKAEITHDRFGGKFQIYYMESNSYELQENDVIRIQGQQFRVVPWKSDDYLAINKNDEKDKNKKLAKKISGEDWMGWRDLLHILSANINEFEDDSIKRLVLLINKKAPD